MNAASKDEIGIGRIDDGVRVVAKVSERRLESGAWKASGVWW